MDDWRMDTFQTRLRGGKIDLSGVLQPTMEKIQTTATAPDNSPNSDDGDSPANTATDNTLYQISHITYHNSQPVEVNQ